MLAIAAAGCHRQQTAAAPAAAPAAHGSPVHLVVDNNNVSDFDVFLVQGNGTRSRLGTVDGGQVDSYSLQSGLWTGPTVGIVATPIGGFGAARSGPLTVDPGDTITFTIQPNLGTSFATVK
jgi:hypothetical protein